MRVMLVSSQYLGEGKDFLRTFGGVFPPLGLLSIASVLRKEHAVAVIDCQFHTWESALQEMDRFGPDAVAIATMIPSLDSAFRLAREAKRRGCVVILGGQPLVVSPERALKEPSVDIVVIGEAEETMAELCRAMERGTALSTVRGILFRRGDSAVRTGRRPLIADLDTLPMNAWDLVPVGRYKASAPDRKQKESIILVPSRGCPWHCSFCNQTVFGHTLRFRSAKAVVEEVRLLHERYGKRDFAFRDDVTIFPRRRIEDFCTRLIGKKMDVGWNCSIRLDLVDSSLLELMKRAGCYRVSFGIESGSARILEKMNKQMSLDIIRKAVKLIDDVGISMEASFIMGFPGETEQDVRDTVRLATTSPAVYSFIQFFHPHPGTDIYDEAIREGSEFEKDKSRMLGLLKGLEYVPNTLSPEFMVSTHSRAHRQICWHPKRVISYARSIKSFDDISKGIGATIEVLKLRKR